ncbi:MAG: NAD(+)/NADH kinase [Spirochaetales bacterium]|nr:NAD(+)/NADH kinase [Spirochaetales bacterium]
MKALKETAVIVKSKTRLEQLIERFNTQSQAKFYIAQNKAQFYSKQEADEEDIAIEDLFDTGEEAMYDVTDEAIYPEEDEVVQAPAKKKKFAGKPKPKQKKILTQTQLKNMYESDFADYEEEHENYLRTVSLLEKIASGQMKTKVIERSFLPNNIFTEKDIVIVVGQDGLVANTAKYVNNIPIIAVNPDQNRFDGILLPFNAETFEGAFKSVVDGTHSVQEVTMAAAILNDGQRLLAFNDLFIGVSNHSSARYKITFEGLSENHSSSGIIVSTGAGSTGWLSSLYNMASGISRFVTGYELDKVDPMPMDTSELVFIVREPFISKTSQATITAGRIPRGTELLLESNMASNGVIFSDGILADYLQFNSGSIARIRIAEEKALLVRKE